jgi:hypothetical protein
MRPTSTHARPSEGWRWLLRPLVALKKYSLDRRLLAGERPSDSAELAERRAQLLEPRHRHDLADRLEQVVEEAWKPAWLSPFSPKVPLRRREIRRNRSLLLALARDLREESSPELRGVILADRLLTDGGSPLYAGEVVLVEDERLPVEIAVRQARTALLLS